MINNLGSIDIIVVFVLLIFLVGASMYAARKKKSAEEYFMANHSLRWWSVAGSIFGTNIHAQQIIGMMGVGYSIGFAQSHYEIWAIPAILLVSYVFVPIYRKQNFFTLSQFLESRFNSHARLVYTILMVAFIIIQLIGGLYIGSRTLGLLFADSNFTISYETGIFIIAFVTVIFSVFGGMESVVIADNILTVIMILAILLMGFFAYHQPEIGSLSKLLQIDALQEQKMHLYLPANHPKLPWLGIFSGLTILHMFYWTTNQYQVQRVLAAKTERDAKLGSIAAGFLKLIIPFFSIAAGVAAFYIFKNRFGANQVKPDDTFLTLLKVVIPAGYGVMGLILAGLICAIFSAIYSMMNSLSTMMAFDVYKKYIRPNATDKKTVRFGQFMVFVVCFIASVLAYTTYNPNSTENFFLKLANQTSYIKPGLVVVFFWGVLWKKTNPLAAVIVLAASPFIGLSCDWLYNNLLANFSWIKNNFGETLNFLYRVFAIFFFGSILIFALSSIFNNKKNHVFTNHGLSFSLTNIGITLGKFLLTQVGFLLSIAIHWLTPQQAAIPAALFCFILFLNYLKKDSNEIKWYQSDILYAGILTSAMVFIMYYFA